MTRSSATALLLVSVLSGAAFAAPFQNGSFELGGIGSCNTYDVPAGSTLITGWTVSVGNIDWEGAACGWQASNGSNSLDLVGQAAGGIGGIEQTFDTIPGAAYVIEFDLAGNYGSGPVIKPLAVTINGVTTNYTFDTTGRGAVNMGWTTKSLNFTPNSTSSTIRFVSDVSAAGGTLNAGAALDNVRIALAVEPRPNAAPLDWAHLAAAAMIALAGLLLLGRRRG
jgi:choice-of-anchor C domain-containing protein